MRLVILGALAVFGIAAAQNPPTHQHHFKDAEKWAHVFDDPARDAWQKPHQVIQALDPREDAVIADIGAGTGYFAMRFANMVPKGTVYAVDVEPAMVKHLAERARKENLRNVVALRGSPDDPRLPMRADLVVLVDVYHHIDAREKYFRRVAGYLKPGGRVAIIDFRPDSPQGPPKSSRIAPGRVEKEMRAAGFVVAERHDFLPYQYFLVFRPK